MSDAKRVLILSAGVGGGHVRAAQALEEAFRQEHPHVEVRNLDASKCAAPQEPPPSTEPPSISPRKSWNPPGVSRH